MSNDVPIYLKILVAEYVIVDAATLDEAVAVVQSQNTIVLEASYEPLEGMEGAEEYADDEVEWDGPTQH